MDAVVEGGDDPTTWTLATGQAASPEHLADLAFAWRACRAVKSNAILLASGRLGGGRHGQVNRVDSCRLAVERAGERAAGSVAASDAFFPFADGAQILVDAGVTAIVQPGGSVRDDEVVEALGRRASRCTSPAPGTSSTDRPPSTKGHRDRTDPRRDGDGEGDQGRAHRPGRRPPGPGRRPGPRHRAGRQRPGLDVVRQRQAQGLRRGRHQVDPGRPARHDHAGRGRGARRAAQRRSGLHRLHRAAAAAQAHRRERRARPDRPGQGRRRAAPDEPRLAGARQAGAAAVHAARHRRACCAATTCRSTAPRSSWSAAASPSADRSGCC